MYTIPTMHAIFVVHCWISMRPSNHTQPTNLQLYWNQSTNHSPSFGERGPPNILLLWVLISVNRSLCVFLECLTYHYIFSDKHFSTSLKRLKKNHVKGILRNGKKKKKKRERFRERETKRKQSFCIIYLLHLDKRGKAQ